MKSIYWFRNDLRLNDNLTLNDAIESSDELLFIYIQDTKNSKETEWKFSRMGRHRRSFLSQGLSALSNKLSEYGHSLNYYSDNSLDRLLKLVDKFKIDRIYCESIDAYEELVEEKKLRQHKIDLNTTYQSGLYLTDQIPFSLDELPDVFTSFRKQIELKKIKPNKPLSINLRINRIKSIIDEESITFKEKIKSYANSSFPISENVKDVFVNLKEYFVVIESKDGKSINEKRIRTIVNDAGYDVRNIEIVSDSVGEIRERYDPK